MIEFREIDEGRQGIFVDGDDTGVEIVVCTPGNIILDPLQCNGAFNVSEVEQILAKMKEESRPLATPWISCSDRMPPDDDVIIVRCGWLRMRHGSTINKLSNEGTDYTHDRWILYNEATWKALNHD